MFAPNAKPFPLLSRTPLKDIDAVVSGRLGTTRVAGNAQPAVFNRQIAMYLAKHVGGWSTTRIGKFYNGRDHSTVCHALKRIAALREADPDIELLLSNLTVEIQSGSVRSELSKRVREMKCTLARAFPNWLDDDLLDALADRIVERLKVRSL
jgi:hypothetical protein